MLLGKNSTFEVLIALPLISLGNSQEVCIKSFKYESLEMKKIVPSFHNVPLYSQETSLNIISRSLTVQCQG